MSITGDDSDARLTGFGVLGTAIRRTVDGQDGPTDVSSYAVWGLLGTPDENSNIVYTEVNEGGDYGTALRAAVVGRNALHDEGAAVYGECRGYNEAAVSAGFIAGRNPIGGDQTGVFGQGPRGVVGVSDTPDGAGVIGVSPNYGVFGNTSAASGVGVRGANTHGGLAGEFVGNVKVTGASEFAGDIKVTGDVILTGGGDIAEIFATEPSVVCEPGLVMVMSENGVLVPCNKEYDKRVVGVISGAGTLRPAITLAAGERDASTNAPIALIGTVYCRVNADAIPIEIGDMLTTSKVDGHATKAIDPLRSFGAVIGKALAPLANGRSLLPILLTRQ
jgi:hypothetical protein